MKAKDFKLWQVFINTAGYRTIVYRITKQNVYVLNYNGNFYSIKLKSDCDRYQSCDLTPEEFFEQYPLDVLTTFYQTRDRYKQLLKLYNNTKSIKFNRTLLLIIKRRKS